MRKFFKIQRLESGRYLPIIIITGLIFIAACWLILQFGINSYQKSVQESQSFIELEEKKVEIHSNIALYQIFGYKQHEVCNCLFALLYNSTPHSELQSFKDDGFRLEINKPEMGANAFDQPLGKSSMDYNWIYLFFGSAAFLILGFVTYHKKEDYVKFLLNFGNYRTVYAAILASKILIILGFLVVSFLAVILQFQLFNGIRLSGVELRNLSIFFFVLCFGVYIVSFALGMIFGKLKSTFRGVSLSILSWVLLVILIPEIFNVALAKQTKSMFDSIYSHELKKLEIFSQAEKSVYKEMSKYNTPEDLKKAHKRMIQKYLDGDFKKILALEKKMLENTIKAAEKVHFYSIFTPVTFYKSVGNEISGYSYNGLIAFYKENIAQYEKFVKYCLENATIRMRPKDNPFIKNPEDYLVHLESSLPEHFTAGVLICLAYCFILTFFSYRRFKKYIFPVLANPGDFDELEVKLPPCKHTVIVVKNTTISEQLYNTLMGRAGKFPGTILIDGKPVSKEKQNICYIPDVYKIPGELKLNAFISLAAGLLNSTKEEIDKIKSTFAANLNETFEKLEPLDKVKFLFMLARLKKAKIFLLEDTLASLPVLMKNKLFAEIKSDDSFIVELLALPPVRNTAYDRYTEISNNNEKGKYLDELIGEK